MAKHLLSAARVDAEMKRKSTEPMMLHDGGGLYLQRAKSGSVSWIFRFKSPVTLKWRDMGLGSKLSLKAAREAADAARKLVHENRKDPIVERDDAKAKAASGVTFRQRFDFMMRHQKRPGWRRMFVLHAFDDIGDKPIAGPGAIGTDDVTPLITRLLDKRQFENARKLQIRIAAVLKSATNSPDTVAHKQYICNTVPTFKKVRKNKSYASIEYGKLPAFFRELQRGRADWCHEHAAANLALEFVILTVCRTGDVRGVDERDGVPAKAPMLWRDLDLKRRIWTIPAVKTADQDDPEPFEIPLSDAAIDVLTRVRALGLNDCRPDDVVFQGDAIKNSNRPLGGGAMRRVCSRNGFTTHGMKAAFKGYASNELKADKAEREVIETAMAHKLFSADKGEGAYMSQVNLLAKRRKLMSLWADYVTGARKVVKLKAAA